MKYKSKLKNIELYSDIHMIVDMKQGFYSQRNQICFFRYCQFHKTHSIISSFMVELFLEFEQ